MASKKKTTIAMRIVAQDAASKALKALQTNVNKTANTILGTNKKVQTSNAKTSSSTQQTVKARITASKQVELALAKQRAGTDKTSRKIVALNMRYEKNAAKMRALARAGKPIPPGLAKQAVAAKTAAAALKKLREEQNKAKESREKFAKGLAAGIGAAGLAVGVLAVAKAVQAFSRAMVDGVKKSIEFSKATNEVMTIADKSEFSIEAVKKQTLELSKAYGTTAVEQARGLYQAISGGADTAAKATDIMTAANKFAISGVTDMTTSIDGLINATNVFGKSGLTAARAADIMQAGIKAGKTTAAELATELGSVSGIAKNAGLSFEEVVASVAAITTKGVTTSAAVTQLRSALVAMAKTTKPAADEAERLFGNRGAFSLSAMRAAGGFVPFLKKIRNNANFNEKTFFKLFGRVEAVNAAMNLVATDGGEKYDQTLKGVVNSAGEVDQAMKTMMESFGFQIRQTKSLGDATKIAMGEAVTGSENASKLVTALNDTLDDLQTFFTSPEGREAVNEFFGDFAKALSSVLIGVKSLEPALKFFFKEEDNKKAHNFNVNIETAANRVNTFGAALKTAKAKYSAFLDTDPKLWTKEQKDAFLQAGDEVEKIQKLYTGAVKNLETLQVEAMRFLNKDTQLSLLDKVIHRLNSIGNVEAKTAEEREKERQERIKANEALERAEQQRNARRANAAKAQQEQEQAATQAAKAAKEREDFEWEQQVRRAKQNKKWVEGRLRDIEREKEAKTKAFEKAQKEAQKEREEREREEKRLSEKIADQFRGVYSAIKSAASSAFSGIGEIVDGQIKTWNDGFREFFKNLGMMILDSIANYLIGLAITTAADQIAAKIRITNSAAEGAADTAAGLASIPGLGILLGLAAGAATFAAILAFQNDTKGSGQIPKMNRGGLVGGPPGIDKTPAMLSRGEYVLPRHVVDSIRAGKPPATPGHYNDGGLVTGGAAGGNINITLASAIPQDRASIRRMVRGVILPELRALNKNGGLGLVGGSAGGKVMI